MDDYILIGTVLFKRDFLVLVEIEECSAGYVIRAYTKKDSFAFNYENDIELRTTLLHDRFYEIEEGYFVNLELVGSAYFETTTDRFDINQRVDLDYNIDLKNKVPYSFKIGTKAGDFVRELERK